MLGFTAGLFCSFSLSVREQIQSSKRFSPVEHLKLQ